MQWRWPEWLPNSRLERTGFAGRSA
jgi:hypothetical protein